MNIAVIGAGFMGSGITQVSAAAGHNVQLWDVKPDHAISTIEKIGTSLDGRIAKGKMSESEKSAILENIHPQPELEGLADADLLIEAVVEDKDIKSDLFSKLDAICKPETIFASNTSAIPISYLANATQRADRFIGLHFFSPVPAMKLVEVVRGLKTSEETKAVSMTYLQSLGKTGVLVSDTPGFLINRIMHAFRQEVFACLQEGVASLEDIDTAVKLGLGHPMGPFELNDFAGLDIGLATIETLYEGFCDPKWKPSLTLKKLVAAGETGRKAGKGWYDYTSGEKKPRTDVTF